MASIYSRAKGYLVILIASIVLLVRCDSSSIPPGLLANSDTLVVYDFATKEIVFKIPSRSYLKSEDITSNFVGELNDQVANLPTAPPTSELIDGAIFTTLKKAGDIFNISDYPVRTTVKILGFRDGAQTGGCTGQLVGPNLVLTAGHCLVSIHTRQFYYDSIKVVTLFDNGTILPNGQTSKAVKAYLLKSFIYKRGDPNFEDITLLEFPNAIGLELGYVGIGIHADDNFYRTNVFHKLSYPAIPNPLDPTEQYNGDTLYYNYGLIDTLPRNGLGLPTGESHGAPGQSGGGYLYANGNLTHVVGIQWLFTQHRHVRINEKIFYSFKEIIESNVEAYN